MKMIWSLRTAISAIVAVCILSIFATGVYAAWYSYYRAKIIERNSTPCKNTQIAPDGLPVCIQEIVPPTLGEKVFGMPTRPDCDQSATTTPCSELSAMVDIASRQEPAPIYDTLRAAEMDSYYAEHSIQSGIVDEHVTVDPALGPITICGRDFVARHVYIDGIDIARRIAEILPKTYDMPADHMTLGEGICSTVGNGWGEYIQYKNIELPVYDAKREVNEENHAVYFLVVAQYMFRVDVVTGSIYSVGGYDGTLTLLGALK
jgi:hypothetical protein